MTTNETNETVKAPADAIKDFLDFSNSLEPSEEERAERRAARRAMVKDAVVELETKFSERGLRFTEDFHGACPLQAFGWIDGQRFYFRFRGDSASLRVGTVNPERAQKLYDYDRTVKAQSMVNFVAERRELAEGEYESLFEQFANNAILATNDDSDALPTDITALSVKGNVLGEQYAGDLNTTKEIVDLFTTLVDNLEPYEVKESAK